jgi:hypothetical protein
MQSAADFDLYTLQPFNHKMPAIVLEASSFTKASTTVGRKLIGRINAYGNKNFFFEGS